MSTERPAPGRAPFVSGPIQILPAGLLGFLQLKSPAGRNPEVLNGDVQPTFDVQRLYLNQQAIHATQGGYGLGAGSGSGNLLFNSPAITVPLNEWWFCHYFTVQTSPLSAGDIFAGLTPMAYLDPNAPSARFHLLTQPVYGRPTGGFAVNACRDFWLPPGAGLGAYVDSYTVAAAESVVGDLFYSRLPI